MFRLTFDIKWMLCTGVFFQRLAFENVTIRNVIYFSAVTAFCHKCGIHVFFSSAAAYAASQRLEKQAGDRQMNSGSPTTPGLLNPRLPERLEV